MIDVIEDAFPLFLSSTPCREITNTCVWIGATKSCYSLIPIARCITEHFPQLCDLHQLLFVSALHLWLSFQPLSAGKAFPGIVSSWPTACRWLCGFVGMGGLGMMTFRALDNMLDATELLTFFRLANMLDATELFTWSHCISVYGDQTNQLLQEPCRLEQANHKYLLNLWSRPWCRARDHCQVLPLSNWDLLLQDAEGSGRRPKMVDVPRVLKARTLFNVQKVARCSSALASSKSD